MKKIRMPDGSEEVFPDTASEATIRGRMARKRAEMILQVPREQRKGHDAPFYDPEGAGDLSVNNVVRSVATGVPMVGGALNKLNAATNALLAPAINPLLPDSLGWDLKGDTFGERLERSLAMQEGMDEAFAAKHRVVNAIGNATGAVAGTVVGARYVPTALKPSGSPYTKAVTGTTAAGLLNAADAGVRTEGDVDAMMKSGAIGLGFGAAAPIVGSLAGKVVQNVTDKVQLNAIAKALGLDKLAAKGLRNTALHDGRSAAEASVDFAKLGRGAMLADLGSNWRGATEAAMSWPGKAKGILLDPLRARVNGGAGEALESGMDEILGPYANPNLLKGSVSANEKAAFESGKRVLSTDRGTIEPDDLATQLEIAALPQGKQIGPSATPTIWQDGMRADVKRIVGNNDPTEANKLIRGGGTWGQKKLTTSFGKERADAALDVLEKQAKLYENAKGLVGQAADGLANAGKAAINDAVATPKSDILNDLVAGGFTRAARGLGRKAIDEVLEATTAAKRDQIGRQILGMLSNSKPPIETLYKSRVKWPAAKVDEVARALLLSTPGMLSEQ